MTDENSTDREEKTDRVNKKRAMTDYARYTSYVTDGDEFVVYDSVENTGWISIDSDFVIDLDETEMNFGYSNEVE